jgi:enoyl-CoA hydratase
MQTLRIERRGPLALLRLDKARGNAIDDRLVEDLLAASRALSEDDGVRGVLLASAHPTLFCPGLDLVALLELDRPALRSFMLRFAEMTWSLFGLSKPMVAAVSGHAVAGGCILALTADYRVLKRGARIGLNEVKIGLPLPWSIALLLQATVSPQGLARVALLGRNFEDEEAVAAGLADEIVGPEGFEEACLVRLEEFAEKDPWAVATTKRYLRSRVIDEMRAKEVAFADDFLDGWFSDATQERVRGIVASLKRPPSS